jgi:ligand-binding sensor domain-containing protein
MSIAFEGDYLWLGLNGGVIRHDLRTYKDHELYTVQNRHAGLMSPGVYKIVIDAQGNKWFGTYGGGLTKFDGKQWKSYHHKDGLGADIKEAIPGNPHISGSSHHTDPIDS